MVLILQFHHTVLCLELMFYIRCWEWEPHKIYVLNNIMQCNVILWQISVTDVFKSIGNISHLFLTLAFSLSVYDSCLFFKSISFFFFFLKHLLFLLFLFSVFHCYAASLYLSFSFLQQFSHAFIYILYSKISLMYLQLMTQFILTHKLFQSDDKRFLMR